MMDNYYKLYYRDINIPHQGVLMATEIIHGTSPRFTHEIVPASRFYVTVRGYYTTTDKMGAGGVLGFVYNSSRPEKQVAELIVLKDIFDDWWAREMARHELAKQP